MLKYIAILGVLLIGKITAAEIVDVEVADPYDQLIEQLQKLKTAGVAFSECAKLFEHPIDRTDAIMHALIHEKDGTLDSSNSAALLYSLVYRKESSREHYEPDDLWAFSTNQIKTHLDRYLISAWASDFNEKICLLALEQPAAKNIQPGQYLANAVMRRHEVIISKLLTLPKATEITDNDLRLVLYYAIPQEDSQALVQLSAATSIEGTFELYYARLQERCRSTQVLEFYAERIKSKKIFPRNPGQYECDGW